MSDPSMREWIRSSRAYGQIIEKMGHVFADWHIGKIADHVAPKITDLEQENARLLAKLGEARKVIETLACYETPGDHLLQTDLNAARAFLAKLNSGELA
jgi:hypothetical protein